MGWTQPICKRCWRGFSFGQYGEYREPTVLKEPKNEVCSFCGGPTIAGIYTRFDPSKVPHPYVPRKEEDDASK